MSAQSNTKIMFIDDEKNILNALKRLFYKESYEMYFFDDPKKGHWAHTILIYNMLHRS